MEPDKPAAVDAGTVPPIRGARVLPEPLASRLAGREKRKLGDVFGLTGFGVNLTRIPPGAASALRHAHLLEDEFVYILEGSPILVTDRGETLLEPGMCAGFKAGTGDAHCLINRSDRDVVFLEVGARASKGEDITYPDDDVHLVQKDDGSYSFLHKDGASY